MWPDVLFISILFLSTESGNYSISGLRLIDGETPRLLIDGSIRKECTDRRRKENTHIPSHVQGSLCCDIRLKNILNVFAINPANRLDDVAKAIQKRVERRLGVSYEVIVSSGNFVVSSHYHGNKLCKTQVGGVHLLAYETPKIRKTSLEWKDSFKGKRMALDFLGSAIEREKSRLLETHYLADLIEDLNIQPSISTARAAVLTRRGNNTDLLQGQDSQLPEGTHCDRIERRGNKCCSGAMFQVMDSVIKELRTSPEFDRNEKTPGIAANLIKRRIQMKFGKIFEVIVAKGDFEHATHQIGDLTCKFETRGLHVMAYESPQQSQYNPMNYKQEAKFSFMSSREPLGTTKFSLPNQKKMTMQLEINVGDEREGFPKGSHCNEGERLGSRCCNLKLFNAMHSTLQKVKEHENLGGNARRSLAKKLRTSSEEALNIPVEVIVSNDDFVMATHGLYNENICKFRKGQYYVMVYETPAPGYKVGQDQYADNGLTSMVSCMNQSALQGASCCSQELRYSMTKAFDMTTNHQHTKMNTDSVARAVVRAAQQRFNTQMNTIVSRGDFVWRRADGRIASQTSPYVCKLDLYDFHILTFESGTGIPRPDEFLVSDFGEGAIGNAELSSVLAVEAVPPLLQPIIEPLELPFQPPFQNGPFGQQFGQFGPMQFGPQQFGQQFGPQQGQFAPQQGQFGPQQGQFGPQQSGQGYGMNNQQQQQGGAGPMGQNCFSGDNLVKTPDGPKKMSEIEAGDFVLTANMTHTYFAVITQWMHIDPGKVVEFLQITMHSGHLLELTGKHLIYKNTCNGTQSVKLLPPNGHEIYASELIEGDCLYIYGQNNWKKEKIQKISRIIKKGIYAPLTQNGRIVVNGLLVSCYSDVKEKILQATYFDTILLIRKFATKLFGIIYSRKVELPVSNDLWMKMLNLVLPQFSPIK